jgi:hypothetical protein
MLVTWTPFNGFYLPAVRTAMPGAALPSKYDTDVDIDELLP